MAAMPPTRRWFEQQRSIYIYICEREMERKSERGENKEVGET